LTKVLISCKLKTSLKLLQFTLFSLFQTLTSGRGFEPTIFSLETIVPNDWSTYLHRTMSLFKCSKCNLLAGCSTTVKSKPN
jgi:hypothetical protein